MHPEAPPAQIVWNEPYPEFPTIGTPLEQIEANIASLTKKLEKMPLDEIGTSLKASLDALRAHARRGRSDARLGDRPDRTRVARQRRAPARARRADRRRARPRVSRRTRSSASRTPSSSGREARSDAGVPSCACSRWRAVALVAGCLGGSDAPEFFSLRPEAGAAAGAPVARARRSASPSARSSSRATSTATRS